MGNEAANLRLILRFIVGFKGKLGIINCKLKIASCELLIANVALLNALRIEFHFQIFSLATFKHLGNLFATSNSLCAINKLFRFS